jgi:hypothetical protein
MKVNNPNTGHGKMIIRYKGNNELLKVLPEKMKRIYMHRSMKVRPDVHENLIIETELFDGLNVLFSLSSANLYCGLLVDNDKTWVTSEEDCAAFYEVNIDSEQVVFEGSISFHKEITPEFISRESYQILLFFKNSKDLMELLDKNKIDYIYHSQ